LVVRSVKRILSKEHDVVATVSATEALALCAGGEQFDLILCDLMLPDGSGLELLREVKTQTPSVAVIMITAYGTVENAVKAMQAGATNFVQKPWDNERVLPIAAD